MCWNIPTLQSIPASRAVVRDSVREEKKRERNREYIVYTAKGWFGSEGSIFSTPSPNAHTTLHTENGALWHLYNGEQGHSPCQVQQ